MVHKWRDSTFRSPQRDRYIWAKYLLMKRILLSMIDISKIFTGGKTSSSLKSLPFIFYFDSPSSTSGPSTCSRHFSRYTDLGLS